MPRDQIDAALHQDPLLADAAAPQLQGERQAARRVIPEQIVGDEDVVAAAGEDPGRPTSIDRSRTDRACSCQIEQNEQRNGQPRAVSTSQVGRCARQAYCRRQPSTSRRAGSGTSSSANGSGSRRRAS